jgi:hypothetical protein
MTECQHPFWKSAGRMAPDAKWSRCRGGSWPLEQGMLQRTGAAGVVQANSVVLLHDKVTELDGTFVADY